MRGLWLAAGAFTAWGLLSPGNEILLRQITPLWMQALRALLAGAIVLALWPRRFRAAIGLLGDKRILFALVWGGVVSFTLFGYAQTRIPAAFTTLGFYTSPLWTGLFAWWLLREPLGKTFFPAALVLLGGGWVALTGGGAVPPDAWGMVLAIASGATWGVYAVQLRRHASHVDWRNLLLAALILGAVVFTVLALMFEPMVAPRQWTRETWVWTVVQAVVPTIVALGLYQASLQRAPASKVNLLVGLELASTLVFAALVLDAHFSWIQLGGVALVLAAVTAHLWVASLSS